MTRACVSIKDGRKRLESCDRVLCSLADPLLEARYHVLRYNSRGVGESTGSSSFTGFSEAEDLKALVQWALGQLENIDCLVLIVSHSDD